MIENINKIKSYSLKASIKLMSLVQANKRNKLSESYQK